MCSVNYRDREHPNSPDLKDSRHPKDSRDPEDLKLPLLRVAVLHHDAEVVSNPAWDAARALTLRPRFEVVQFSPEDAETLLAAQLRFDCIVLAHNVLAQEPALIPLLRNRLRTGVVILQQRALREPLDLHADLVLSVGRFRTPIAHASLAEGRGRDYKDEIILSWPYRTRIDERSNEPHIFEANAITYLTLGSYSPWQVVLEGESPTDRVKRPVLVRAAIGKRGIVATSLLLEMHKDEHSNLLCNAVTVAALGVPEVALISQSHTWAFGVARLARLKGCNAVALCPTSCDLDEASESELDRWRARGCHTIMINYRKGAGAHIPAQVNITNNTLQQDKHYKSWLKKGGRVVVAQHDGSTHTIESTTDIERIARSYSKWLNIHCDHHRLSSSLTAMRAHLRLLQFLEQQLGKERLQDLGLEPVAAHRDRAIDVVRDRMAGRDNVDETVSVTVAVLDICAIVRKALGSRRLRDVCKWLEKQAAHASKEDRLEIARALQYLLDTSATDDARVAIKRALDAANIGVKDARDLALESVLCVARYWRYRVVSNPDAKEEIDSEIDWLKRADVRAAIARFRSEVTSSTVLAAEVLGAFCEWLSNVSVWGALDAEARQGEATKICVDLVDACVMTMVRRGAFMTSDVGARRVAEVATEALAIARFASLNPAAAVLSGSLDAGGAGDEVLREAMELRQRSREYDKVLNQLNRARSILAVGTFVFSIGASGVLVAVFGLRNGLSDAAVAISGMLTITLVTSYLLQKQGLWPEWAERLLAGISGVMHEASKRWRGAVEEKGVREA